MTVDKMGDRTNDRGKQRSHQLFTTEVVKADSSGFARAVKVLLSGDLVAIPTETVYGLAANAFDAGAVAKIFTAKDRPSFDPLIVHVSTALASIDALVDAKIVDGAKISAQTRSICEKLIQAYWPGPLTLLLPKTRNIPDLVTAGLPLVGIRMPAHRAAKRILLEIDSPLAAPSANRFGRISPTTAEHVLSELEGRIQLIVDGGASSVGIESTVVKVDGNHVGILRPGGISQEDLQQTVGPSTLVEKQSGIAGTGSALIAPGNTASHYAPSKPMILWTKSVSTIYDSLQLFIDKSQRPAILFAKGECEVKLREIPDSIKRFVTCYSLSLDGNPEEAARNLFSSLRKIDESEAQVIFAEDPQTSHGLWLAIRDRLVRASSSSFSPK